MLKYFIYCRKSSEDDDRQMLSIVGQLSELNAMTERDRLSVVETLTESKSAREPGREVFNEMLRRIDRGEANAILTWKLDRLARNFDDGGKLLECSSAERFKKSARSKKPICLPTTF
jgi:site-specific DNA recombinase